MNKFSRLKTQLESDGWDVFDDELPNVFWWGFELWRLESVWSPAGQIVYLTLKVDPMPRSDSQEPNYGDVWAITLDTKIPTSSNDSEFTFRLNKFSEACEDIVLHANQLRGRPVV